MRYKQEIIRKINKEIYNCEVCASAFSDGVKYLKCCLSLLIGNSKRYHEREASITVTSPDTIKCKMPGTGKEILMVLKIGTLKRGTR